MICRLEQEPKDNLSLRRPLLQYSTQQLKSYLSSVYCEQLRASIEQYLGNFLPNANIELQLVEFEQFYKELTIVNQFFREPFNMPSPCGCISQLTCQLVVFFQQSNNIWLDINRLFNQNETLVDLTREIFAFV